MMRSKDTGLSQSPDEREHAKTKSSIAVVPLAIPIIAGPGSMTSIIVYVHKYSEPIMNKVYFSLGAIAIAFLIFLFFYFSSKINKMIGPSGTKIATRIMGLILIAIAMSMMGDGLRHMFPGLAG